MKKITITNVTGARNRGVEALVVSIIEGVEHACGKGKVEIALDSGDLDFDTHVFKGRLSAIYPAARFPLPNWPTALQRATYVLGAAGGKPRQPTMLGSIANLRSSDLLVATGGDVFTSDYGGLSNHARILEAGKKVALLAQTIGPFTEEAERRFRKSIKSVALCTVRESETLAYLSEKFPDLKAEQTADVAFLLPVTSRKSSEGILEEYHNFELQGRRLIGLSISSGILSFRSGVNADGYLNDMAGFVDHLNSRGYSVIFIPHVQERQVRNNDIYACLEVLKRCNRPRDNLLLSLSTLSAADYKGIIGLCEVLIGARTHATIASMSQGIPTVSIAYSRKAWGIMKDYYGNDLGKALTIDISDLNRGRLSDAFEAALANGHTQATADLMKARARLNFERIRSTLEM